VEGLTPLREAIAEKLSRENDIDVDPHGEVLVISGVQEGINVALQTLLNPADEVILPDPYYYADPLGVVLAGGVPVYTRLEEDLDFRINPEDVKAKITDKTKAIFYVSPNCPTGSVFQKEDLEEIAQIAVDRNIYIITDEIYEKLVYDDEKHISIASLPSIKDRTISMFGFSKAYAMTGWRIGYLTANRELMKTMIEVHSQLALCTSSIAQHAALAALTGPQDTVEEMRKDYEERRNVIASGLNRLGLKIKPPKGSFYAYANISDFGISGLEFAKRLARDARVLGYPGMAFTHDESGEKYIRFAYTKSTDELKTAIIRMGEVVKTL
jgi:aminotransferase